MADEQEFDRAAAVEEVKNFASRVKSLQAGLYAVSAKYSNPSPTSDSGKEKYLKEMYQELSGSLDTFRDLMNDLKIT